MCFNFPSAKYSRLQSTLIKWSRQSLLDSDFQEHSTILLGMSGIARTLTTFSRRIAIPETSTRLGRATPQGTAPFDHLNTDMFMLLSHLNGLRNHEYFCMLMHMPSTHETLKMVLAGQVDSQTPAPLLIKAPRARLWTLLVTDLCVNFGKLSLQAGRLCGKHVWTILPYWRQPNPTVTLEGTTLHEDFNLN